MPCILGIITFGRHTCNARSCNYSSHVSLYVVMSNISDEKIQIGILTCKKYCRIIFIGIMYIYGFFFLVSNLLLFLVYRAGRDFRIIRNNVILFYSNASVSHKTKVFIIHFGLVLTEFQRFSLRIYKNHKSDVLRAYIIFWKLLRARLKENQFRRSWPPDEVTHPAWSSKCRTAATWYI